MMMMMMMMMVTMMVNVCDDDCYLVMKVILVKEVMSCDISPVAMFFNKKIIENPIPLLRGGIFFTFSQKIQTPPPPPPFLTTSVFF